MTTPKRSTAALALARSATLVTFSAKDVLGKGVETDDAFDVLNELCELVVTPSGRERWSLRDYPRKVAFTTLPLDFLRQARSDVQAEEDSPTQRALDRSLREGWSAAELNALPTEDVRALMVVAGWWQGCNTRVPDVPAVAAVFERINLFSDMREMAGDHFVGRDSLREDLRAHLRGQGPSVFAIHGVGGVGKSALIAKHVIWAVDEGNALVAPLDFDDPTLNASFSLDILARIVKLIARQTKGEIREQLERLTLVAEDAANTSRYRSESSSRSLYGWDMRGSSDTVANLAKIAGRPILIVFDTTEQVQRRGYSAVEAFAALVQELGCDGSLRILVSGRAEVPELGIRSHAVSGLRSDEAQHLLMELSERHLPEHTASMVIDSFGTYPLTVRLLARLLSDKQGEGVNDLVLLGLHAERINAELYRRVLLHIRDPEVRKLAHPGLVLRRVTPDIIKMVLAKPCGVKVPDDYSARDLLARLALEAMLVERSRDSSDELIHRSDIRGLMLPQLLADMPELTARIQRAAIRYYSKRSDPASRTEELYHRLMLGQNASTVDAHWDEAAANDLYKVRDELPEAARILLSERLPDTFLTEEDRRLVSDSAWLRDMKPQIARLMSRDSPVHALALLHERRGPRGRSLLPSLEIDALERTGDIAGAFEMAREERRLASLANDPQALTTYTLHIVRLAERAHDLQAAAAFLEEALGAVRDSTIDRLRLIVALLGLWRRTGNQRGDVDVRTEEAIDLYQKLGVRRVLQVPGLLRDLAAEVGAAHSEIQDDAIRILGVDALVDGRMPDALRKLDERVQNETGKPYVVAGILPIKVGDDTQWEGILNKPRGETGRILQDLIEAFPEAVDGVREAVTNDYQREADAALFRREPTRIAPRA